MTELFSLKGQRALVTGASSGLGRHFAKVLAEAGAELIVAARRQAKLKSLVDELTQAGHKAQAESLDVQDPESIAGLFERLSEQSLTLDVLINNAGIARTIPALDMTVSDWQTVMDTNLRGAFLMAQGFAQQCRDQQRAGVIVNIASVAGLRVGGQLSCYAASKTALISLTKSMAVEWARHKVRVNALAPGYILTDMNREFFESPPGQALMKRIPQRRIGEPDDLSGPLLLLASPASSLMTGSVLVVDGGHSEAGL